MKRRIMFLVGTLELGGIERLVTEIAMFLNNGNEWEPSVCCIGGKHGPFVDKLEQHNIPIYECRLNVRNIPKFLFQFARLVRKVNPVVIHSQIASSLPWQVLGARLGTRASLIVTQHSEYENWEQNWYSLARIRIYYRLIKPFIFAYTAVSKRTQCHVARLTTRSVDEFLLINNSVDVKKFISKPGTREIARSMLGISDTDFVIGNVARLALPKGQSLLLSSIVTLREKIPNLRLVIVGDGPIRFDLEEQAKAEGTVENILFLGHRTDTGTIYPAFDCFSLTSLREGNSIAMLEAMACSLPIVTTDVGIAREIISADTGFVIPTRNVNDLSNAFLTLYRNPNKAKEMGHNSRMLVEREFSQEVMFQKYLALYNRASLEKR